MRLFGIFISLFAGGLLGWVINHLANVLPIDHSPVQPICRQCTGKISWLQSFLYKKCPYCSHSPSMRQWIVQIILPILSLIIYIYPPERTGYTIGFILVCYFCLVFVIDMEYRLILRSLIITGILIGTATGIFLHGVPITVIGGLAGFLIMLALYYLGVLFIKFLKRSGKKELETEEVALGFGDVYLAAINGLILGWPGVTAGLVIAILLGGGVSAGIMGWAFIKKSYYPLRPIPYAPFLIISTILLLFIPK